MTQQVSLFEMEEKTLLSDRQREIKKDNPFFGFFSELEPEKVVSNTFEPGKYYSLATHPLLEAFYTAQTIALENIYRALDARFLDRFEGSFDLTCEDKTQLIKFVYAPDSKSSIRSINPKNCGANLPEPYVEFTSDEASALSWSGFHHASMKMVPIRDVRTMEELIEYKVREILKRDDFSITFH